MKKEVSKTFQQSDSPNKKPYIIYKI